MSNEPASALLGGLLDDARELVSTRARLTKLEVREELGELKGTIQSTGIALAAVVLAGLLLTQAAALGLSAAADIPLWASSAILGVLVAIAGYVAFRRKSPANKIDLVPSEAIAGARHDLERIADAAT